MTRKEAIEKLELMRQKVDEETYRALILAIKALEQEPTDENLHREREQAYMQGYEDASKRFRQEPCDNAVSRDAVIKCLERGDTLSSIDHRLIDKIKRLPSVTQKSGKCKNCKYFEYDSVAKVDGVPLIVAHESCNKWGDGCKTNEDGYCFLFDPQESEVRNE